MTINHTELSVFHWGVVWTWMLNSCNPLTLSGLIFERECVFAVES